MSLRISDKDKLDIITSLQMMLSAGVPLLDSLESLSTSAKGTQLKILKILYKDVDEGNPISDSLARFPDSFDRVTISILKAAETAGTLNEALLDIAANIKKSIEVQSKVMSALAYPSVVMFVFFGVLITILTFVIPRISVVFTRLHVNLPLGTRILIRSSELFVGYWMYLGIGLAVLIFICVLLFIYRRRWLLGIFLKLPLVSGIAYLFDLSNFSYMFYLLLKSGVSITKAIKLAGNVVLQPRTRKAIEQVLETVEGGNPVNIGLKESPKVFPNFMVRITEAGEKTGSLELSY